LPVSSTFDEILLFVIDDSGNKFGQVFVKRKPIILYDLSKLVSGTYYFQLYRRKKSVNHFSGYLFNQDIPIIIHNDRRIKFKISPVYKHNMNIINKFRTDEKFIKKSLKSTKQNQSNNKQIKKISNKITFNIISEYDKIRNIHNWIADNIYYDMDAFNSKLYKNMDTSALSTLSTKKSVCQGYSDLSVAMLRAVGIPAMGVSCYALGLSSKKKWSNNIIKSNELNHRITAAFVNNRWVLMDITWDSSKEYINGEFKNNSKMFRSYKYFDVTIPFLSNSHRLSLKQ
jgi:transglutaminase-like putative cysteine protease